MMRWFFLVVTGSVALSASAQVDVQLRLDREKYLLYESVPATVQVNNYSAQSLRLEDQESSPWLRMQVMRQDGRRVAPVGLGVLAGSEQIEAGRAVARVVDLVAFYQIREIGKYRVNAMVRVAGLGGLFVSNERPIEVLSGRPLWTKTVGVAEEGRPRLSTYTLLVLRVEPHDWLYARVEDAQAGVVYGVVPLGASVSLGPPRAETDKESRLHVLHQVAPRHYRYAVISPRAAIVKQESYSDFESRPQLTRQEDGQVKVAGGEWIAPPGAQRPKPPGPPQPPPEKP
ncbi:MAG: hypothetical protein FJ388_08490 [Verrucomicrobia bacterium]|nr:hypothetical protein [Verrucomicrobiota bacterium]